MVKTLARSIREFKKPAALTPVLVTVEVILECIIPLIIANLVNQMQAGCGMDVIVRYGIQLLVMAILALVFGVAAGNTCATASTGFARNLRKDMFYCIQDYSFENIDKFSVSSLVTRMTTDVVNVQMSFIRTALSILKTSASNIPKRPSEWRWPGWTFISVPAKSLAFWEARVHPKRHLCS